VITLQDMKEYLAERLVGITENIVNAQCSLLYMDAETQEEKERQPNQREELKNTAKSIFKEAGFLGLKSTGKQAARLYHYAENKPPNDVERASDELHTRFHDEIESLSFFYVPADKLAFYNKTDLFGDEFKTNFPQANTEISEAGNCFAFDRYTASVFHLMRALEVVLKVLFQTLGLPPLTIAGERNWNGILQKVKDKLDSDKSIPDHEFYDNTYAFLVAAKNPMRNATMHVDAVYDEASAKRLFDAIGAFVRHVATKLKENP
jgi:hypothetical protein